MGETEREQLAKVFKALGDETRLRLVAELACKGEVTCGEFAVLCACSNSALTYHQRVLIDAELIRVRRAGQYRMLSLRPETFDRLLPGFLDQLVAGDQEETGDASAQRGTALVGSV